MNWGMQADHLHVVLIAVGPPSNQWEHIQAEKKCCHIQEKRKLCTAQALTASYRAGHQREGADDAPLPGGKRTPTMTVKDATSHSACSALHLFTRETNG